MPQRYITWIRLEFQPFSSKLAENPGLVPDFFAAVDRFHRHGLSPPANLAYELDAVFSQSTLDDRSVG
jgi:hypothetical protein